jgi:trimethylamine--corrinoid protein Co-methyltransferase
MQFAEFLTGREVEQIHEASLEILENVGILVRNENARGIYAKHGCRVDSKSLIVKIPRDVIEDHRKSFVPHFTFMGRDPQFDNRELGAQCHRSAHRRRAARHIH